MSAESQDVPDYLEALGKWAPRHLRGEKRMAESSERIAATKRRKQRKLRKSRQKNLGKFVELERLK